MQGPCEGRPLFLVKGRHPRVLLPTSAVTQCSTPRKDLARLSEKSRNTDGFPELELPLLAVRAFRNAARNSFFPKPGLRRELSVSHFSLVVAFPKDLSWRRCSAICDSSFPLAISLLPKMPQFAQPGSNWALTNWEFRFGEFLELKQGLYRTHFSLIRLHFQISDALHWPSRWKKERERKGGREARRERKNRLALLSWGKDMSQKNVSLNWDPGDEGWKNASRKLPLGGRSTVQTSGIWLHSALIAKPSLAIGPGGFCRVEEWRRNLPSFLTSPSDIRLSRIPGGWETWCPCLGNAS